MVIKVGINGFGCIGCNVLCLVVLNFGNDIEIVVINDLFELDYLVYMLKYDFVYGCFKVDVVVFGGDLLVNGKKICLIQECDLFNLKWDEVGVDVVIELIGLFLIKDIVQKYIDVGVKKVIMLVLLKDDILMFVFGVNDKIYVGQVIVFNVLCIINCLVLLVKVINDKWGIKCGLMIIVYVVIVIQKIVDGLFNKDWCGGCGILENIILFFIGVVKVVGVVILELNKKFIGMSFCVLILDVLVVDLIVELEKEVIYVEICVEVKVQSEGVLKGVLGYIEDKVVVIDFCGEIYILVFDVDVGIVLDGIFVKLVFWYDNEWGYFNKCLEMVKVVVVK